MKWFYDIKIGTKLISTYMLIAVLASIIGVIGILNLQAIAKRSDTLFKVYGIASIDVGQFGIAQRSTVRDILFHNIDNQKNLDALKEQDGQIDKH